MNLSSYYQSRISLFTQQAGRLQLKEDRLSMGRLVSFLLIFLLFFALYRYSQWLSILASISSLGAFGWLVIQYNKTEKQKNYARHLAEINTLEFRALTGDNSQYADGHEFIDRDHSNSYDLDLFGHASVFQFINRTTSNPGAQLLAQWLNFPADIREIKSRQEAVQELSPEIEWRQRFMTLGHFNRQAINNPAELLSWTQSENLFRKVKRLTLTTLGLSSLSLGVIIMVIIAWPAAMLLVVALINVIVYFRQGKKINTIHQQVSKSSGLIQTYAEMISSIEEKQFKTEKLNSLQQLFKTDPTASESIKILSKLLNRLDTRLNILVSLPLNLFFFWDIHYCLALEKWKNRHSDEIARWLAAMSEFEVLNSIANMAFNNPDWVMPHIVPVFFTFRAENMGHMLIPRERRVLNNLEIEKENSILIVTGSNMSGKSTFLRTCGVNAVIALAGGPVCATSFTMSHMQIHSSMRISDSLEDNTSSFYAELKRLANIIRQAEADPRVFLLLDEILRGTNSNDRYTGSVALIRQLSDYGTVAIVATHDLKLAEMEKALPGHIENYHFDVKVEGEELYFDYKLTPGICTSLNASILMKKMGIRIGTRDEGRGTSFLW
jgi:ABC-type lipoprotein export system ATPase subunit